MTDPVNVFSVQDETGTVYQLNIHNASPLINVSVGDTGNFTGHPDQGTDGFSVPASVTDSFVVSQVLSPTQFSITTLIQANATWPRSGSIQWTSGANVAQPTTVLSVDAANAYIDVTYYQKYHGSRGTVIGTPTNAALQGAIVQATDYLDQRYRFRGVKLVQTLGNNLQSGSSVFIEPWATPFTGAGLAIITPSTSPQVTQWPRQGVNDFSGNTVFGIPLQIKMACAELALRVLNGATLQADYDPNIVAAGGVLQTTTQKIGPMEITKTYDTKLGLGFFASFPQVDRMLAKAGLLVASKGRTLMR